MHDKKAPMREQKVGVPLVEEPYSFLSECRRRVLAVNMATRKDGTFEFSLKPKA
jgi:hypothetical protein